MRAIAFVAALVLVSGLTQGERTVTSSTEYRGFDPGTGTCGS